MTGTDWRVEAVCEYCLRPLSNDAELWPTRHPRCANWWTRLTHKWANR